MYISDKYWDGLIGGSDDSLTLIEYLGDKRKYEEGNITLNSIFSELGFDRPGYDFKESNEPITVTFSGGLEPEFYYAINVIMDLAAILLECKINGRVVLNDLLGTDADREDPAICLTSTEAEDAIIRKALKEFAEDPMGFSLSEMCDEDEMQELSDLCRELLKELFA